VIRRAGLDDIDEAVTWGRKFYEGSKWNGQTDFDLVSVKITLQTLIEGDGAVFLNGHGIIGGIISPLYFNHSEKIAAELFWYADKGGKELKIAFDEWAVVNGATGTQMTCLVNDKEETMRRLYRMQGFEAMETSFYRRL